MGRDKSDVKVQGVSMLEHVESAMRRVVDRIVLLGPDRPNWETWPDSVHVRGPLAGIATALARAATDRVLVVAVDHPFVRAATLSELVGLESDLAVVPVDEAGIRQVTCAIYPTSIASMAAEEAIAGGSIQTLLDRVSFEPVAPQQWRTWGEDGRSWLSIDSEEALGAALKRLSID